jgi:hypothetical protein
MENAVKHFIWPCVGRNTQQRSVEEVGKLEFLPSSIPELTERLKACLGCKAGQRENNKIM